MTPVRRQYLDLKARYPGAILFFRMGDFYETFDEDAKVVAEEVDIALTSRPWGKGERIPLAGVPYHALESYLAKLIAKGYRVAICEQTADPKSVKGIVPRDVVQVVSPGTVVAPHYLDSKRNNYLAAYYTPAAGPLATLAGIAYIDITTSEFHTTQLPADRALAELARLAPAELLTPDDLENTEGLPGVVTGVEPRWFGQERARQHVLDHFRVASLEAFGCDHLPLATGAVAAILNYLAESQPAALALVTRLATYSTDEWMQLDLQTRRNLELFQRSRQGLTEGSLLSVLDLTKTAMGGRLLRRWLERPLIALAPLRERQERVAWLHEHALPRAAVIQTLAKTPDVERLTNRVRSSQATPREVVSLGTGLQQVGMLADALSTHGAGDAEGLAAGLSPCPEVCALIASALNDDAPSTMEEGAVIRPGFSPDLDGLRDAERDAQQAIMKLEQQERERTGIRSLKVGFNKVFGYYIEVSNTHRRLIPFDYHRKQTLVGAERFFTPELKEWETTVLTAQDRMSELERDLFRQVCAEVAAFGDRVLQTAAAVAELDCAAALAEVAVQQRYVRPDLITEDTIRIESGRHPVVEQYLDSGAFVPNDALLDNSTNQIALITGPNMSGKSTYLRQVALIVLLAQIGSYVPANAASIGLVDRIFSRVGAQDDLATGQSTFMVEMVETANILHHATARSLVILDEIGRGTSTYDGLAIAQSVVEHLHNHAPTQAKTLFATHYHELTGLSAHLPRVHNYTFAVAEETDDIVFLRRILPGSAGRSYGVHVARLAGLPEAVIRRAEDALQELEQRAKPRDPAAKRRGTQPGVQLALISGDQHLKETLLALDLNGMTPLGALNKLYQLQTEAGKSGADQPDYEGPSADA